MLSATTANYESGGPNQGPSHFTDVEGFANEKNSIFTFPIPYFFNEVKNVKPFSMNMSNLKLISKI